MINDTKPKKYLFIVQGEGRGHLTQAIAAKEILEADGQIVTGIVVGKSRFRQLPQYFIDKFEKVVNFTTIDSPNFIKDKKQKTYNISFSILYNIFVCYRYFKSAVIINKKIKETKPDVILNFYEPIMGLYKLIYKNKTPLISIAHQYVYHHPAFVFAKGKPLQRIGLKFLTRFTSIGSVKELGLSISKYSLAKYKKTVIVPPLIRSEVLNVKPEYKSYMLIYILNEGLSENIIDWHNKNKDVKLHCFWDNQQCNDEYKYDENLNFHKIDDQKFIELMAGCSGFITTAGFESVCEAMYLKKPILLVPVQNHYEQLNNAIDAENNGAGVKSNNFEINKLLNYILKYKPNEKYIEWTLQSAQFFLKETDI